MADKEPLMSAAICAELEIKVFDNSVSAVSNLVEMEALGAVNAPDIAVEIWSELETILAPNPTIAAADNEPLISTAICAELEINVFDKILRTCLENKLTVFNLDYNIRGKKVCVYPEDDIKWTEEKVFANLDQLPQDQLVRIMSDVRINYPDKIAMFEFKIQSVTNLYITNTETVPHVVDNDLQVAVCPCSGLHQFKFIQPSLDVMEKVIWADYSPYAVKWMEILVHEWNGKDFHTFFDNNKDRLNYDGSVINGHGTWEKFLESFENEDEWLIAWAKIRNLEHQFIDVNLVNDYNKVVELIPANKNVLLQCSNIFLYESNYFNRGPLTAVNSIDYVKQVRNISNKVIFNGDINGSYYDMINTNRLKWI